MVGIQKTDSYKAGQSLWITEKVHVDKETSNTWYFFVEREQSETAISYFTVDGKRLKGHFVSIKKADLDLNCCCAHCAHCYDKQTGLRKELCKHLWACLFKLREEMSVRWAGPGPSHMPVLGEFFQEVLICE